MRVEETINGSGDLASEDIASSGQYTILFALWLLVFSASSQLMIVVAMLPAIGEQLSISTGLQGLLVSSYAVMVGVFALVAGPVSDKFGRRRMLLAGSGLMTAALVLHAVPGGYAMLLAARWRRGRRIERRGGRLHRRLFSIRTARLGERLGDVGHRRRANRRRSSGRIARRPLRFSHAVSNLRRDDGRYISADSQMRPAARC